MKRLYKPYWEWEDWKAGMWRKLSNKNEEKRFLIRCIEFTSDHVVYGNSMKKVISAWPNTMLNSLTNKSLNRKAFLGHCACCYEFLCPEYITRMAWKELTNEQRFLANREAEKTIHSWELERKSKYTKTNGKGDVMEMGFQMSLQLKYHT